MGVVARELYQSLDTVSARQRNRRSWGCVAPTTLGFQ